MNRDNECCQLNFPVLFAGMPAFSLGRGYRGEACSLKARATYQHSVHIVNPQYLAGVVRLDAAAV